MKAKILKKGLTMTLLSFVLILSACGGNSSSTTKTVSNKEFTKDLKEKYAGETELDYAKPITGVDRDYEITLELGFTLKEKGFSNLSNIYNLYADSEMRYQTNEDVEYDEDKKKITIRPGNDGIFQIPDEKFGGDLFEQGDNKDWGNAQQYYLKQYVDLKTGEELEKPLVTVIEIKHEIEKAPNVQYTVNEDGMAQLTWDKVDGATEYVVMYVELNKKEAAESSNGEMVEIVDTTKETSWSATKESEYSTTTNKEFRMKVEKTEDRMFEEYRNDETVNKEEFVKNAKLIESEYSIERDFYYTVIAINDKGSSAISNLIDVREVSQQTPYQLATYLNTGGLSHETITSVENEIGLLPSHAWVEMGDGSASQKLIVYDTKTAKLDSTEIFTKNDEESAGVLEKVEFVSVAYKIEGTSIEGYVKVLNYNEDTYKEELKALQKRQDGLRDRGGSIEKDDNLDFDDKKDDKKDDEKEDVSIGEAKVTANSALSEYLAIQMLSGNTKISLKGFNESSNKDYLLDAWYEAIYQNPLILGVGSIRYGSNNTIIISYDQDSEEQAKKQKEIQEKVKEVIDEIITDDMSDIEKEEAINDYLVQNAEYDTGALENAEKNNFKTVDKKFDDSFTAYGILINNKGVCAGYAGAFKLLADEAGLESIVVTGNLDGSLPHAWNRVNIDGQWLTIDTTNNDNEFISNALFNIPDSISGKVLVEDKLYVMDSVLEKYTASEENNEYYRYNNKYYTVEEITAKLEGEIKKDGKTVLRTDYSISDQQFQSIAADVSERTGKTLQGTYYLGVVYLEVVK